jgi:predicted protein tyrosine phosphatase
MLQSSQEHRFRVKGITLLVLSRVVAELYVPEEKALRISISDPGLLASLPEDNNIIETLYLEFHDKIRPKVGVVLFSEKHAQSIYEFINKYEDYAEIIIHCAAGMSRSPAIAWALAEFFGSTTAEFFYTTKYWPNQHVYALMHRLRTGGSS